LFLISRDKEKEHARKRSRELTTSFGRFTQDLLYSLRESNPLFQIFRDVVGVEWRYTSFFYETFDGRVKRPTQFLHGFSQPLAFFHVAA
jgi:hypothetical protein